MQALRAYFTFSSKSSRDPGLGAGVRVFDVTRPLVRAKMRAQGQALFSSAAGSGGARWRQATAAVDAVVVELCALGPLPQPRSNFDDENLRNREVSETQTSSDAQTTAWPTCVHYVDSISTSGCEVRCFSGPKAGWGFAWQIHNRLWIPQPLGICQLPDPGGHLEAARDASWYLREAAESTSKKMHQARRCRCVQARLTTPPFGRA